LKTGRGFHLPRIKAIILDLDGTMVDSEPLSRQAWDAYLAAHGRRLDDAVYSRMIGRRTDVSAGILREAYSLPQSVDEILAGKNRYWRMIWQRGLPPMPGLEALLADLDRRGLPWGVATSSPRDYAEGVLRQLGIWQACQALVGGDEVAHSKPAPDGYLLAAERLGHSAVDCLAVEDSVPGMAAAAAAGMVVVGIPHALSVADVLPDGVIGVATLSDVLGVLDDLTGARLQGTSDASA
jgi:HAD superfamily hydrolase (TIGR01509 family)